MRGLGVWQVTPDPLLLGQSPVLHCVVSQQRR